MKKLLSLFTVLVLGLASAGPGLAWKHGNAGSPTPPTCNTYPGATCDPNGWTVFAPVGSWCVGQTGSSPSCNPATTDTRIILVSQSLGTDDGTCGTAAHPCQTPFFAAQHYGRPGSPDWFLMACGDTWSAANVSGRPGGDFHSAMAQGPGTGAFGGTTGPLLISSYDTGASTNPPVPDPVSCSARPMFISDIAGTGGVGSDTYTAIVGIANYCPGRDPNNVATTAPFFSATEALSAPGGMGFDSGAPYPAGAMLIEDSYVAYCGGAFGVNTTQYPTSAWPTKTLLRRNVFINNYPVNTESSGIGYGFVQGNDPTNSVLYQNVIDSNTYMNFQNFPPSALAVTWAGKSGFSHNIYIAGQCGNGDVLCTNSPVTLDGNIISNDPSSPAFRVTGNYNNNLWLLNPRNLSTQLPNPIVGTVNKNVFLDMGVGGSGSGMEFGFQYVNEPTNNGSETVTQNILANSPQMAAGAAILFDASGSGSNTRANGNTVTGNYIYNVSGGNNAAAFVAPGPGAVLAGTFTAGSSYTAKGSTITSGAQSTEQPTSQNYVLALISDLTGYANDGPNYSLAGNLGTVAGQPNNSVLGMYQSEICSTNSTPNCASILFARNGASTYNSGTGAFVFASAEPPGFIAGAQVNTGIAGTSATVQATGSSYTSGTGVVVLNLNTALTSGDSVTVSGLTGTGADLGLADIGTSNVLPTGSSYNNITGDVTLNLDVAPASGNAVSVTHLSGGGADLGLADVTNTVITTTGNTITYNIGAGHSIVAINGGSVNIAAATSGSTISYKIATGKTISTITGGVISDITSFADASSVFTVTAVSSTTVSYTVPTGLHIATVTNGSVAPINGPGVLFGSNFSGTYSGSIYYPYQAVAPTCHTTGCQSGNAAGFKMDVIVDGSGHIVATWLLGDDGLCNDAVCSQPGIAPGTANGNDPGTNYTSGDVLDIPMLGGTGSGAQFTVTQIASNNASPANNAMDAAGTNNNSQTGQPWTDPNRTAGWYYAKHVAGATPKATFTGVVANGILTVSSLCGGCYLYPGDAVVWSTPTQTISDYIKTYSGGVITTLGSLSATACASGCANNTWPNVPLIGGHGTGATATVVVSGGSPTVTSVTATGGGPGGGYVLGDVLSVAPTSIGGSQNGLTNFTVVVTAIANGNTCGITACTGGGGNGTYALTGLNQTIGSQSMSSYGTEQLIQATYGQSKQNWNTALTAPVINQAIAQGFNLSW